VFSSLVEYIIAKLGNCIDMLVSIGRATSVVGMNKMCHLSSMFKGARDIENLH